MQGLVGRDHAASAPASIGVVRRAYQLRLLAFLQLSDSFVPATDDLASSDHELQWLPSLHARVENAAVWEGASVMDLDLGATGADLPSAFVVFYDLEATLGVLLRGLVMGVVVVACNPVMVVDILWLLKIDAFLDELLDSAVRVLGHALDLVNQSAILHEVDLGHA